jgi:nucleotide-binding universal stress UspA family protein
MKTILVPLDGSELAEQVLPYIGTIAGVLQAEVRLVRIVRDIARGSDSDLIDAIAVMYGGTDTLATELEAESTQLEQRKNAAQAYLELKAEQLRAAGLTVETLVRVGPAADLIVELADGRGVTMIAMATHGYGGLRRWALGSITDKVLHAATVPVFVVRARRQPLTHPPTLKRILMPYDGSILSRQALPYAVEIAAAAHADIEILRAIDLPGTTVSPLRPVDRTAAEYVDYATTLRHYAEMDLEELMKSVPHKGFKLTGAVTSGPAAEAIVDETAGGLTDLIVMATHGYSGLKRWALGSVADKVIHATNVPVLLIRAADEASETERVKRETHVQESVER